MVTCDKCHSGIDLNSAMKLKSHTDINEIYSCKCGNSFSYFKGIINDFCEDHFASEYSFISNILKRGRCTIIVGETFTVELGEDIPIINKIFLSPFHGNASVYVEPFLINNKHSFKILSSERKDNLHFACSSIIKVGQEAIIDWTLYGRTKELLLPVWRQLLIQSKEQKMNKNYLLSFLSSAMSLESYINLIMFDFLKGKGIDERSINVFLKESTIPDKLFNLLQSLLNVSFSSKVSKRNLQKLFNERNKIAHGKSITVSIDEAKEAFKLVLITIIEIENSINTNAV